MNSKIRAFALAVLAFSLSSPSHATLYQLNKVIGDGGISGFITTDGTLGTLSTSNITDFNLVLDDGSNTSTLLGPLSGGSAENLIVGSALSATSTDLLFNFGTSGTNFALFQLDLSSGGNNYYCVSSNTKACSSTLFPPNGEHIQVLQFPNSHQTVAEAGSISLASIFQPRPRVYNIDRSIGAGGVSGFIATDGTIGTLSTGNITDFKLVLDDGTNTSTLLGPLSGGSADHLVTGTALTATTNELLFDFSAAVADFALFQLDLSSGGNNYYCVSSNTKACSSTLFPRIGEHVQVVQFPDAHQTATNVGTVAIGSVPEPASLALMGLGLAGIGYRRHRSKIAA